LRISVTLPSVYPEALRQTLENLDDATTEHELEVIVVAPWTPDRSFYLRRGRVLWVEEANPTGCVAAHAAAFARATGELVTAWTDDHDYVEGWDAIAVENFLRRERPPFSLGLRQVSATPRVGTVFGRYYPYFPLMRCSDVAKVGGWFDTRYTHGFSDPDLGLRVWQAGGRCEWADEMTVVPRPENDARRSGTPDYLDDVPVFLDRWGSVYGAGYDLSNMRAWNVDVLVEDYREP
jgi:hypothetical protein